MMNPEKNRYESPVAESMDLRLEENIMSVTGELPEIPDEEG